MQAQQLWCCCTAGAYLRRQTLFSSWCSCSSTPALQQSICRYCACDNSLYNGRSEPVQSSLAHAMLGITLCSMQCGSCLRIMFVTACLYQYQRTELVPLCSDADSCHNPSEQRGRDVMYSVLAVYLQHCYTSLLHDPVPGNY